MANLRGLAVKSTSGVPRASSGLALKSTGGKSRCNMNLNLNLRITTSKPFKSCLKKPELDQSPIVQNNPFNYVRSLRNGKILGDTPSSATQPIREPQSKTTKRGSKPKKLIGNLSPRSVGTASKTTLALSYGSRSTRSFSPGLPPPRLKRQDYQQNYDDLSSLHSMPRLTPNRTTRILRNILREGDENAESSSEEGTQSGASQSHWSSQTSEAPYSDSVETSSISWKERSTIPYESPEKRSQLQEYVEQCQRQIEFDLPKRSSSNPVPNTSTSNPQNTAQLLQKYEWLYQVSGSLIKVISKTEEFKHSIHALILFLKTVDKGVRESILTPTRIDLLAKEHDLKDAKIEPDDWVNLSDED